MENILALDASTKATGWAIKINNQLEYGVIKASDTKVEKRILKMRNGILDLIKKYNVTKIVIEEVRQDGYNNRTGKVLMWLQGVLVTSVYESYPNIEFDFIGASSWRSKIKIQGKAVKREQQKIIDIQYVKDTYGIITNDDDIADAICILTAYNTDQPTVIDGFEFK